MASKTEKLFPLPDQDQRDQIHNELGKCMLVEAAAGTGKTTSMIVRMVAILATGRCKDISKLVAVTFTKKAAAELRSKFRISLEQAANNKKDKEKNNLEKALSNIDKCFIGTIHSFCARLLRERPVEANIDVAFSELDEVDDARMRHDAWNNYINGLISSDPDGILDELKGIGIQPSYLEDAFLRYTNYPDVDSWPIPKKASCIPDIETIVGEIHEYINHMNKISKDLPYETGSDTLIPMYRRIPRRVSNLGDIKNISQLIEVLNEFKKNKKITQKVWKQDGLFTAEEAKIELSRWQLFREKKVIPLLDQIYQCRYDSVIRVLEQAEKEYDRLKRNRGCLNYQDLLIKSAELLREHAHIREYFSKRFTHLLVDEFQDTDPIQAEVMMLLTATDPNQRDWRKCYPRSGSLFVVGDPKQSIYRFRRADIVTYNQVKEIIERGDGKGSKGTVVQLSANFRSTEEIINWVNDVFKPVATEQVTEAVTLRFPDKPTEESPDYVPLQVGRIEEKKAKLNGVYYLAIPEEYSRKDDAIEYDAERVARTIRYIISSGITIPRNDRDLKDKKVKEKIEYSDFLIITRNTTNLGTYAKKLQKYGIPHQITGGTALNEVRELKLLYSCLTAVIHPDNPVALVGALRSYVFGISDAALYNYKKAGGFFNFNSSLPKGMSREETQAFDEAFSRLKNYSMWISKMPHISAIEKIIADLGLLVLAANHEGGDIQAGGVAKAIEILRNAQTEMWTISDLVKYLGQLVEIEEKYDGISVLPQEQPMVRVMNLHKVKGLEAPIVFLADPSGESNHGADIHIDRTGNEVQGYMLISRPSSGYQSTMLAKPENWEKWEEKEMVLRRAEELRLRYVAATRAGVIMIISQRLSNNKHNPWQYFYPYIPSEREMPDPGEQKAPRINKTEINETDVKKASNEILERILFSRKTTYAVKGAKELALSLPKLDSFESNQFNALDSVIPAAEDGEHGVEWGSVIHSLLQVVMENPKADILELARSTLIENNIDVDHAQTAKDTVESVMKSDIWQWARRPSNALRKCHSSCLWMRKNPCRQ